MSMNQPEDQFETVLPVSLSLDGAPDGYQQLYVDDVGPFYFPIPSDFITKRLTSPPTQMVLFVRALFRAYSWFIPFSILALSWDSLILLLVAAVGLMAHLLSAWRVLLGEDLLSGLVSLSPRFNRKLVLSD